ncbi:GSU2204 family CXXCH-containing (seleno)protein [Thermodesulfatator atlanticus]|uniref:GSU2204 family CXXCH-containing (seleno)protein n=1 Tax=Thermodesulfatator atlanticus TaxID=501497 RepID=UPI0003B3E199|nr:GSU2204 family CXXCH-containing (seleno)protein [Thermodesulfatator atlanticus]
MKIKSIWFFLITFLVLPLADVSLAEEKNYEASISLGAAVNDTDESANRAAEYRKNVDMDSNWHVGGSLDFYGEKMRLNFEGLYQTGDEQQYWGNLELGRAILFRSSFYRFYHRLDHDTLANLEAHSMEELKTVTKDSTTKWVSLPKGAGLATVYHTDFNAADRYGITRSQWKNNLKVNPPGLAGISFELYHRYEERKGLDQARTMSKCAACHVVTRSKEIREYTNDWNPRVRARLGKLSLEYSFLYRVFRNSSDVPLNIYNEAMRPVAGDGTSVVPGAGSLLFDAELQFDATDGWLPFARTPENRKRLHSLKAKYDFNLERHVFVGFVNSNIINLSTDEGLNTLWGNFGKELEIDYNALHARFFAKLRHNLTLTLKAKYMNMDADDVFLDVVEMRLPDTYPKYPGMTYREVIGCTCDITRYSAYDSEEYILEGDLAWRLRRDLKLYFSYGLEIIKRNNASHDLGHPPVNDQTTEHKFKLAANWRPVKNLKLKAIISLCSSTIPTPILTPIALLLCQDSIMI